MGGKHKQAQRTKNNARPSSSGRSAELLGSSLTHFVGFSGIKESGLVMSGFSLPSEEIDSTIDSNFQLVLKKMNKKDSTTKLKALQEFTELIKTADVEVVKAVLPFWPRLYCNLATDAEHRVREATHIAHHEVVLKAKKNLAPYLKQLAGPWYTSQYDTYAPAASAATKAFEDAFPQKKVQEAIAFCQEEILMYICDNLLVQTAESLSNSKTMSQEDAEAKYQRVIISSLQGYALYLNKVPQATVEKVIDLNLKIVSSGKFWKLSKNKIPLIRAAWFGVITSLCQKALFLIEKELGRVVEAVFVNLDESEPNVVYTVWESVLGVVSKIDEWWKYVSVEKVVLPKLWNVLKEGGQGNASVIFPHLLPLMSHLMNVNENKTMLYLFFENLRIGMKHKSLIGSRSNSLAVSVAFVECLQYIILKNESDVEFCEKLINMQLFPVLEEALTDLNSFNKSLFSQIAKLIQHWNRTRSANSNYAKYLELFTSKLDALFLKLITNAFDSNEPNIVPQIANKQIQFLLLLKQNVKGKRQLKVSFTSDITEINADSTGDKTDSSFDQVYFRSLNDFIYKTCKVYVKLTNDKQKNYLIEYLVTLIQDFDNESFFKHLNIELGNDGSSLIDIHRKLLLKWLQNEEICCKAVVDLVFLLFKYLGQEEKLEVLHSFTSVAKQESCLGWCIAQVLSHPHNLDGVIHKWLHNEYVNTFLTSIMDKEIADDCSPELYLILKQAFTERLDGELFISKEAISSIITKLITCLENPLAYTLTIDKTASFAAYISAIIYTSTLKLKHSDDLLLALFHLSTNKNIDEEILSKDTMWEMNTAWQDAVGLLFSELPIDEFITLTNKFADIIEELVLNRSCDIRHAVELVVNYLVCVNNNNPLLIDRILVLFSKRNFIANWHKSLTELCLHAEYIRGSLCSPYRAINNIEFDETTFKYFDWLQFVVGILISPLHVEQDDAEDESTKVQSLISSIATEDDVQGLILELLYGLSLSYSYIKNYRGTKFWSIINNKSKSLRDQIQLLINLLERSVVEAVELSLIQKLKLDGWFWSYVLYNFILQKPTHEDFGDYYSMLIKKIEHNENSASLHVTQVFHSKIDFDDVIKNVTPIESIIVLRTMIQCSGLEVQIAEAFSKIDLFQKENSTKLRHNCDNLENLTWEEIETVIEIFRLFSMILKYHSLSIQFNYWDLIIVPFAIWCKNVAKCKSHFKDLQVKALMVALVDLFSSISLYVVKCCKENIEEEWREVFVQDIHRNFIELWLYICEQNLTSLDISSSAFLQEFGKVTTDMNYKYIFNKNVKDIPKWPKLLKTSCLLLKNSNTTLQLWGYNMLMLLLSGFIEIDSVSVNTSTPHEKGLIFEQFNEILNHLHEVVHTMLLDFRLGEDSCRVEPFTDSYTYTFAYLLLWNFMLTLCEYSSTELRYQYADWLKNKECLNNLLDNIFKLMPIEVLQYSEGKAKNYFQWFVNKFRHSLTDTYLSENIEQMVCWTYTSILSQLPALVRQWWSNKDTRTAQVVERVTSVFASQHLCNEELCDIGSREPNFKNMVITLRPSVREVVAVYTVDEAQMELLITLPANYPLVGPDVECNRQIGGTSHRQWLMQLKMCVLHQNGRIWDGLSLWNNNLDKKFDGVEECYICFAVLHQGTYQMPKLTCQTCKKKFHSACLYKWFSTSNKSTCPICRNLF